LLIEHNHRIDNIRFFLILLVVTGHMFETFSGTVSGVVYKIIYSFHMPAFVFITGYFAKFSARRILGRFVPLYLIFQIVYLFFNEKIINQSADTVSVQFTTPFWHLWFLLSVIIFYLLIPLIDTDDRNKMIVCILASGCVALLAGYDGTVGYYLSLSRTIVFLPFFCLGYYCKKSGEKDRWNSGLEKNKIGVIAFAFIVIVLEEILFYKRDFSANVFYQSMPYSATATGVKLRIAFYVCSVAWILLLFLLVPDRRIPFISELGRNTMSVYLLHGFVKLMIQKYGVLHYSERMNVIMAIIISLACIVLFNHAFLFRRRIE